METLVTVVSVLAGAATLAAVALAGWIAKRRGRAGSTWSLALTIIVALFIAAFLTRSALPVRDLGVREAESAAELETGLETLLADRTWWFVPRGRVTFLVSKELLQERFERLDSLTLAALDAGVSVDIDLDDEPRRDSSRHRGVVELVWHYVDQGSGDGGGTTEVLLPDDVVFTEAGDPDVRVRLRGAPAARCSLDGVTSPGSTLSALVDSAKRAAGGEFAEGWHRVECRDDRTAAVRYLKLTGRGVVVATKKSRGVLDRVPRVSRDPREHGLNRISRVCRQEDAKMMRSADLLVLDEWASADACDAAKTVLGRGGSVVIANPPPGFRCSLVPEALRQPGARYFVDRRPRLTFVPDPTLDHLDLEPGCVPAEGCVQSLRTEPKPLEPSRQRERVDTACAEALGLMTGVETPCEDAPSGVVVTVPRTASPSRDDARLLAETAIFSGLDALLDDARQRDQPALRLRDNHVAWVFSTDPEASRLPPEAFERFLSQTGGRLEVVSIRDVYGLGLRTVAGPDQRDYQAPRVPILADAGLRVAQRVPECQGLRCLDPLHVPHAVFDATSDQQATVEMIGDGRLALDGSEAGLLPAPIRFQWWDGTAPLELDDAVPFAALMHTTEPAGLRRRPLAVATMVGRGHLLLLAYSPFEYPAGVPLVDSLDLEQGCDGPTSPATSLNWHGARGAIDIDALGPGPIRSLYRQTRAFVSQAGTGMRRVSETPGGLLRVKVHRSIDEGDLSTLELADGVEEGHLVDFDFSTGSFDYVFDPTRVAGRGGGCVRVTPSLGDGSALPITVCGTARGKPASLPGAIALESLSRYTGGCFDNPECDEPRGGPQRLWSVLVGLGFAALWVRRAWRRISGHHAAARIVAFDSEVQRRYDPPEAVVAAGGDLGARATTWTRTGAFGGYRPLEPGDRASAIRVEDFLLMAQGGRPILPRVVQRIEEAAPKTGVFVNLGPSMRRPGPRRRPGKILLAAQVAELVAAEAWKLRARVVVAGVGVSPPVDAVAETALHPGRGEIERGLLEVAGHRPQASSVLWARSRVDVGALFYVSDFQFEPLEQLAEWLAETEVAGVRVAGVLVYSPAEFTMVETGRLAGGRVFVDRADWTALDVAREMRHRVEQVERVFEGTSGGLTVVNTQMETSDLELALAERRVLEVLR